MFSEVKKGKSILPEIKRLTYLSFERKEKKVKKGQKSELSKLKEKKKKFQLRRSKKKMEGGNIS